MSSSIQRSISLLSVVLSDLDCCVVSYQHESSSCARSVSHYIFSYVVPLYLRLQSSFAKNPMGAYSAANRLLERPSGYGTPDNAIGNLAQDVAYLWRDLPIPVIAVVHGPCFGGTLRFVSVCEDDSDAFLLYRFCHKVRCPSHPQEVLLPFHVVG